MLFGCCVGVVGEGGKLNTERLDVIKNLGFDFVELGAAQVTALEDEDFAQLKNKLQALSLRCLCMNGFCRAAYG